MRDRREQLKVKIKSLAEEARIIRLEEKRAKNDRARYELYWHRIDIVRKASRNALVAYGFINGRDYSAIETNPKTEPNWKEVERLVTKYGSLYLECGDDYRQANKLNESLLHRFRIWSNRPSNIQKVLAKIINKTI